MPVVPHPIPYQGSKRQLASRIMTFLPPSVGTFYEPFAGSAAMTLAAAAKGVASRYVLGDTLAPLIDVWKAVLVSPVALADRYESIWQGQLGNERAYYDEVRARFNKTPEPAALLYLLARCVKNAVRFNNEGEFNQSPDNRRLGMRPDKMRREITQAAKLLVGQTQAEICDYTTLLDRAEPGDVVYMDPPYQGTSQKRDQRYHQPLNLPRFVDALTTLRERGVSFLVSFDGRTGTKTYGTDLPAHLGLVRVDLEAGRSSQATLLGRDEITVESLYVTPELALLGSAVRQPRLMDLQIPLLGVEP